jgi:hypothetical protein
MKRLAILAVLVVGASCISAQTYGRLDFSIQNGLGQAVPNVNVAVYTQSACGASAGALATYYPTANGGTPLTSIITNGLGKAFVYVSSGCVTVVYSSPQIQTQTYPDQNVAIGGSLSIPVIVSSGGTGATTALGANGTLGIPGPVFNLYGCGAVGNGTLGSPSGTDTANTTAIQTCINDAIATNGEVFVPCGVWNVNSPLTMYGSVSAAIIGEHWGCSIIQYTGTSPVLQGMLTVAPAAPATPCTSQSCNLTTGQPAGTALHFRMENVTLIANHNVPDNLDLLAGAWFATKDTMMMGAADANYFLMFFQQGTMDQPMALFNAFSNLGFTAPQTQNALVTNVYAPPGDTVNNITVTSPIFMGLTGYAVVQNNSGSLIFSTPQFSGNGGNIDLVSAGNAQYTGGLFEEGGGAGTDTLGTGAEGTQINSVDIASPMTIAGTGTVITGGTATQPLTIESTARATVLANVDVGSNGSNITDNSPDTQYHALYDSGNGLLVKNFPADKITSSYSTSFGTVMTEPERLQGTYESSSGATVNLDPALLYFIGNWTANFCGTWANSSTGPYNVPECYEFTFASPTLTLSDSKTVTVAAATSGHFTLTVSGTQNVVFSGSIDFNPTGNNGAGGVGHYFTTKVSAPGFDVNGTPFATGNLADWTNSGVANGNCPVWNSGTSKWTPGTCGIGFANPMTLLGDVIYGGTSGVPTRLAGSISGSTLCLTQTGTGSVSAAPTWGSCAGSAATAFSAITGSINNSGQALVVGSTSSIDYSGTGIIDANEVGGAAVPASAGFLASNSSNQLVAAAYTPANCTPGTTGSDCLQLSTGKVPVSNIPTAIPIANVGSAGLSGTAPVAIASTGVISMHVADTSDNGYLSSTDWNTFNGKQAALNLLPGTYVNGDVCSYASSGTLLNCNTVAGNMGDGSGTTTPGYFPETTSTLHGYSLNTPATVLTQIGAAPALGLPVTETTSWTLSNTVSTIYIFTGSSASSATTPTSVTGFPLTVIWNQGTAAVTFVNGGPGLSCFPSSCAIQPGGTGSISINSGGTAFVAQQSNALALATIGTATNCSSSASPAVCGSAAAGSAALPTNAVSSSIVVNTTAVTANSQIFVSTDDTLGTKLGVTCNSTVATLVGGLTISNRVPGTSFTISNNVAVVTNPLCVSYMVIN